MKKIAKYKTVVADNTIVLDDCITQYLESKDDWRLHGYLTITSDPTGVPVFMQTIVLYERVIT